MCGYEPLYFTGAYNHTECLVALNTTLGNNNLGKKGLQLIKNL